MEGVGSLNLKNIFAIAFFGAIVTMTGFVLLYNLGHFIELACERTHVVKVSCVKTTKILGVLVVNVQTIERLERAWVREKCDGDGCSYRVILIAAHGNIPLAKYYQSDYIPNEKTANQINTYVNDLTMPSFVIHTNVGIVGILFPLALVIAGPLITISELLSGPH